MVRAMYSLAVVSLLWAGYVDAANTGSVVGLVEEPGAGPLPGVTVQISSVVLIGGPQAAISGPDGSFAFHLLPVGDYTAEAFLLGYRPSAGLVRVRSNRLAEVTFQLVPESFAGTVDVTAAVPVMDTTQVNSEVVLDADYLAKALVGTDNRYYHRILGQVPGVSIDAGFGGTEDLSVYGSTSGENAYLVDGLNTTDPLTGSWTARINIDAVQELSLQTGGFEAEYGQATGGIVNLITKSGGNSFSGTIDARYRGEDFTESGEHYDPDERREHLQHYAATLGGPILRDRLWFFVSAQHFDETHRAFDSHFPSQLKSWQLLAKGTWQMTGSTRAIVKASREPFEVIGNNMGQAVLESAMSTYEAGGSFAQVELNSVLSPAWLLEGQVGASTPFEKVYPSSAPDTVPAHYNADLGLRYQNPERTWDEPRQRLEARVSATWFVDELLGSHEFKGGVGYTMTEYEKTNYFNGGGAVTDHVAPSTPGWQPVDLNGDGYFNESVQIVLPEDRAREVKTGSGDIATAFLQDAWRPAPNLTIKPGIRYERITFDNSVGDRIADMSRWQPRFGIAWDLFGTARHLVRASAARFMDPATLNIPEFAGGLEDTYRIEYNTLEYFCNRSQGLWCDEESVPPVFGEPLYWSSWDGQQYTLFYTGGAGWANFAYTVDQLGVGRLRAPHVDEIIVAYEAEIAQETSLELSYVDRTTRDIIEDTCGFNTWVWGDGPEPSFEDRSTWTRWDCGGFVIANPPGLERSYQAWILRLETRQSWGYLMASYTHADTYWGALSGPSEYAFGDADYFPVDFYNRYGLMDNQDRVRLSGYLQLPASWTVAVDGFWSSPERVGAVTSCAATEGAWDYRSTSDQLTALGVDETITDYCVTPDGRLLDGELSYLFLQQWGSREGHSSWQLDLQVAKGFQLGDLHLQAIFSVYNLFNTEAVTGVNYQALRNEVDDNDNPIRYQDNDPTLPYYHEYYGADGSPVLVPLGEPTNYQRPRRYEIGLRIEF
jgi:hypothetical protein